MTYAIPDDIAVELGRSADSITPAESAQWQQWLNRVEDNIRLAFKRHGFDLDTQVGLGDPTADMVAGVEIDAVARKVQNPTRGETSYTKSLDDGSITRRREGSSADVDPLSLGDDDLEKLLPSTGYRRPRAFSVISS